MYRVQDKCIEYRIHVQSTSAECNIQVQCRIQALRVQDTGTEYKIQIHSTGYMCRVQDTGTELRVQVNRRTGHTGTDNRVQDANAEYYNITKYRAQRQKTQLTQLHNTE